MLRMVYLVYNSGIDDDINLLLEDQQINGYSKFFGAHGVGGSGKKLGTPVWPGTNNVAMMVIQEEQIPPLVDAIQRLKDSFHKNPGISIFSVPAETHDVSGG